MKQLTDKLKIGDKVIQPETIDGKYFEWDAEVIRIEYKTNSSEVLFVETKFERQPVPELVEILNLLIEKGKLQSNNRTYCIQYVKNYIDSNDGWKILTEQDLLNKRCSAYKYLIP